MAYCTNANLAERISTVILIQLTDDEKLDTGSTTLAAAIALNSAIGDRLTEAIADADALIDSHIRKRYLVPLATVPALIKRLSVDLSIYYLHDRRSSTIGLAKTVRKRYDDAMKMLAGLNAARIDLGVNTIPPTSDAEVANTTGPAALFTPKHLEDF